MLGLHAAGFAKVSLPGVFSSHMVLQRDSKVLIWGWADPNEEVTVTASWGTETPSTKTDNQANWAIEIKTPGAGGPYTITIKGHNEIVLNDVLTGEVWLCSGQSNMEMSVNWGVDQGEAEAKTANYPNIRFFKVPKASALSPQNNTGGNWQLCTPETMRDFSAVGYFFAQRLQQELENVPIGLVLSAWGGTPAEIWMPENVVAENAQLLASAKKLPDVPWGPNQPGRAYNAMIHALTRYAIAGVIWYQGEANVGAQNYEATLSALIAAWRSLWEKDFPFYIVQIAPYEYGKDHANGALIRDAQRRVAQSTPHAGLVVTADVSPSDDIHPKDKKSVGVRLANLALADVYKISTGEVNGPLPQGVQPDKKQLIVNFSHADGLHFNGKASDEFEIAGADGVFHRARATIRNNRVILESGSVARPVKARYCWSNTARPDVFNAVGLPMGTFATH